VSESTDWNKQRVAATGQGITRLLACCKEILKEKKKSLSRQCSVLLSSNHLRGLVHRHLYCWTLEMMIYTTSPQLKRKCLNFIMPFSCQISYFLYIFVSLNLFLRHNRLPGTSLSFLILHIWNNLRRLTLRFKEPPTTYLRGMTVFPH